MVSEKTVAAAEINRQAFASYLWWYVFLISSLGTCLCGLSFTVLWLFGLGR
jgi:hypothetical protein